MFKHLYSRFTDDQVKNDPKLDCISLFKIKHDLKETSFSPYKLSFNKAVLYEKQRLDKFNKDAYRQYMLPDQKTLIKIDIGETETEIVNELVMLYRNSTLLGLDIKDVYSGDNDGRGT